MTDSTIAFIGGGNMAGALIGGLRRAGRAAASILVVEPLPAQRERLAQAWGLQPLAAADERLAVADTVVWAVKPQLFAAAAAPCAPFIGRGIAGLFARPAVTAEERAGAESLFAPTGTTLWVAQESDLDAVTALSGSGPAYVFYFVEAMMQAAAEMGLTAAQGRQLALATFDGATALAAASKESPETLRAQVTSKGGTTHAAITALEEADVKAAFVRALHAARERARELGDEFGSV